MKRAQYIEIQRLPRGIAIYNPSQLLLPEGSFKVNEACVQVFNKGECIYSWATSDYSFSFS